MYRLIRIAIRMVLQVHNQPIAMTQLHTSMLLCNLFSRINSPLQKKLLCLGIYSNEVRLVLFYSPKLVFVRCFAIVERVPNKRRTSYE